MNTYTFQINDVVVPFTTALDFSQDYEYITAATTLRTMDGTGIRQGTWNKIKTTLAGSGYFPAGLAQLDTFGVHTLHCGVPRAIVKQVPVFAIPSARRNDPGYEPYGQALVGQELYDIDVSMSGNVATCEAVEGATQYRVSYYPKLQVFIEPVKETTDLRGAKFGWSLTCEEV